MQEIDNILERTKANIRTVEAPDYILTRAKQQLENLKDIATPVHLEYGIGHSCSARI